MDKDYKNISKNKKSEAVKIMNSRQLMECNVTILLATTFSGAAGAIPIPMADAIPISATQIAMVIVLGKIFNQKITETVAKGLATSITTTFTGRNIIKFVPGAGWVMSAVVASGITEAVGWAIAVDFAKNAKLNWYNDNIDLDNENNHTQSNNYESEVDKDKEEIQTIIDSLEERAQPFKKGEKTKQNAKDELNKLKKDFEEVLDYLDANDRRREIYDELFDL